MHLSQPAPSAFVQRPSVTALFPYGAVCLAGLLWIACTLQWPDMGTPGPIHLLSLPVYAGVSAINALYLVVLLLDAWAVRRSASVERRAQWAGIGMGLVFILLVQFGAEVLWGPVSLAGR